MEQTLSVNKENVYNEVAKTTSYTGAKMDDEAAYDRIFTTEEDKTMLERFGDESKNTICNSMKKFLVNEKESNDTYTLTLNLSASFDESLLESMERSLFSFFGLCGWSGYERGGHHAQGILQEEAETSNIQLN